MAQSSGGFDLMRVRPIRALTFWSGFPYVFQALLLVALVGLMWMGWGVEAPSGVGAKLFAKAHLTTLVIWGLWWPLMVWAAVWLGRVWCAVCPLELLSHLTERSAHGLGLPLRRLPRWITSGTAIVALYALLQMWVAGAQLHRVPAATAWFLLGLLLLGIVPSLFFRDRAVCRGFCPVGQLLGTYGRGGMLAVRSDAAEVCGRCAEKECLAAARRHRWQGRSCPSLLNPPRLDNNHDCLVCAQCLKACGPANMRLLLRPPFSAQDRRPSASSWPTTVFVMMVSGFVLWELTTEWPSAERALLRVPAAIALWLGAGSLQGYVNGIWTLVVVPLLLWTGLFGVVRASGARASVADVWRRLALPAAIVVSAGHMAKALAKFVSWAPFLPWALGDPLGLRAKTLSTPPPLLGHAVVTSLGMTLVVLGFWLAFRELRRSAEDAGWPHGVALGLGASGYLFVLAGWLS